MGLRPYKDSWFSALQDWATANVTCTSGGGHANPPYYGLQERHPELQLLVSVLSAGPVAPGDNIGMSNVSLIMRSCTRDGRLLQPDRPAYPPDRLHARLLTCPPAANARAALLCLNIVTTTTSAMFHRGISKKSPPAWGPLLHGPCSSLQHLLL